MQSQLQGSPALRKKEMRTTMMATWMRTGESPQKMWESWTTMTKISSERCSMGSAGKQCRLLQELTRLQYCTQVHGAQKEIHSKAHVPGSALEGIVMHECSKERNCALKREPAAAQLFLRMCVALPLMRKIVCADCSGCRLQFCSNLTLTQVLPAPCWKSEGFIVGKCHLLLTK